MTAVFIILVIAIIVAAIFTIRRGTKTDAVSLLLKTISSLLFILLGIAGIMFTASEGIALFVVSGLVCGLIGDIFLDLKFVYPKDSDLHTFTGFGAFMLGHVFYFLYMFFAYQVLIPVSKLTTGILIGLAAGVVVAILIYVTPKLMKLDYGKFRLISSVYAGVLVCVTVNALYLEVATGHALCKLLMFIGLVLFLISDLVLSQIYFGKDKNTTFLKILNHGTYYAGQILIALSVAFLGGCIAGVI